jgi:hypothetical protein
MPPRSDAYIPPCIPTRAIRFLTARLESSFVASFLRIIGRLEGFPSPPIPPAGADGLPTSVQLDKGALLIEFNPKRRHEFQILTPQAIASVRGTKWAMDVTPMQTSTLVLAGEVTVARKNETENVVVRPGQGVDIEIPPGGNTPRSLSPYRPDPITVKQWGPARVKELLDRFGP